MPVVWIPGLLRSLTHGQSSVVVPGSTVKEVIENLEERFPGMKERLMDGERLRADISVVVDGETSYLKLRHPLKAESEVYFLNAISGGVQATESTS